MFRIWKISFFCSVMIFFPSRINKCCLVNEEGHKQSLISVHLDWIFTEMLSASQINSLWSWNKSSTHQSSWKKESSKLVRETFCLLGKVNYCPLTTTPQPHVSNFFQSRGGFSLDVNTHIEEVVVAITKSVVMGLYLPPHLHICTLSSSRNSVSIIRNSRKRW